MRCRCERSARRRKRSCPAKSYAGGRVFASTAQFHPTAVNPIHLYYSLPTPVDLSLCTQPQPMGQACSGQGSCKSAFPPSLTPAFCWLRQGFLLCHTPPQRIQVALWRQVAKEHEWQRRPQALPPSPPRAAAARAPLLQLACCSIEVRFERAGKQQLPRQRAGAGGQVGDGPLCQIHILHVNKTSHVHCGT